MKSIKHWIILSILVPYLSYSQDTLYSPVDIVYHEENDEYFVSNSASGNGYILKLNTGGQIINTFYDDLDYAGGMCLVGDVLYVTNNKGLWGDDEPAYLIGIDITTGQEIVNFLVDSIDVYLDLMTADNQGNLYIGNTADGVMGGKIHKFNIITQQLTDLVTDKSRPFGLCYDSINDRIIFVNSSLNLSFLWSVNPDGSDLHKVYYTNQRLNAVIMEESGNFYFTSWGSDNDWGDEQIFTSDNQFNWDLEIANDHNRPFGMCIGKDNQLVVCNWGDHTLSFIDLDVIGIDKTIAMDNSFSVYPNPTKGNFRISTDLKTNGIEVSILNMTGQRIFHERHNNSELLNEKEFSLQHLPAGSYVIILQNESLLTQKKLIIY